MALNSPGVEVTIVDQSQYLPAAPNSVPLILMATAQNKAVPSGTAVAPGTTAANANKLYRVTSQRDLVNLFGIPFFYKSTSGVPIQGYELNEYGLQTAYNILSSANLVYVLRADIDLGALVGRTGRPAQEPANGSYWLNTTTSTWGINEWNNATGVFDLQQPIVILDTADVVSPATGEPQPYIGNIGDYAVSVNLNYPLGNSPSTRDNIASPNSYNTYWYKAGAALSSTDPQYNTWVPLGTPEWSTTIPTITGAAYSQGSSSSQITFNVATVYSDINGNPVTTVSPTVTIAANTNAVALAAQINALKLPFLTVKVVNNGTTLNWFLQSPGASIVFSNITGIIANIGVIVGGNTITGATFNAPGFSVGTNAQQPNWRATSGTTPTLSLQTGSVWIKTTPQNSGLSINISQYSTTSGTWTSNTVTASTADWVVNNALDSTGGKAIPVDTLYAQMTFDGEASPIQIFKRSSIGASVFSSAVAIDNMNWTSSQTYSINVYVSVPGSSALSSPYTVSWTAPVSVTGQSGADAFAQAWAAAMIPNTTASSSGTYVTLTQNAGGVIILDDSAWSAIGTVGSNGPLDIMGFQQPATTSGDNGSSNINYWAQKSTPSGAKFGMYKTVVNNNITATNVSVANSSAAGAVLSITTVGESASFGIINGGTNYTTGDIIQVVSSNALVNGTFRLKVTGPTNSGALRSSDLTWFSTPSQPNPLFMTQLSKWEPFTYTPNEIALTQVPANNTYWYYSTPDQIDILTNVNGAWYSYKNVTYGNNGLPIVNNSGLPSAGATDPAGPIISATAPSTQSDGTPLVYGDLWINSSNLDTYPVISRWQSQNSVDQWVVLDNSDQQTQNGILFEDARWAANGSTNVIDDPIPTIASLLTAVNPNPPSANPNSAYVDLDAPSANLYPQGMLLWNTRRSGYNVKQYKVNYFNSQSFSSFNPAIQTETSTWVTASGNMSDGSPYMGRKAQRAIVVKALKASIGTNTEIREEDTFMNLIATPNYPELQPDMILLNNDRNNTSYIIGDTPMRLPATGSAISAWATNAAGASATGEDGLVTRDTYLGLYYPSAIGSDITGSQVVLPPSYMMMRTIMYNDTVAYPWFAPAGQRRGVVNNVTNIGYLNAQTSEFVVDKNRVGLRDIEYTNFINPIAYFSNVGILNYGNKNSLNSSSALDRTNVARLVAYLRYQLQNAVRPFIFEPNDNFTRAQVSGVVTSLLQDIQSKRGIYDYLVVCDSTNNTPARIDRNELWIDVAIEPVKSIEFIYIPVRILNTGEIAGLQ